MKWEQLSKEQQGKWNKLAEDKQEYLQLFKLIMEGSKCPWCSVNNPRKSGLLDFHVKSTHGFNLDDMINETLRIKQHGV